MPTECFPGLGVPLVLPGQMSPVRREATPEKGLGRERLQKGHNPQTPCPPFPSRILARTLAVLMGVGNRCGVNLPLVTWLLWPRRGAARVLDVPAAACGSSPFLRILLGLRSSGPHMGHHIQQSKVLICYELEQTEYKYMTLVCSVVSGK